MGLLEGPLDGEHHQGLCPGGEFPGGIVREGLSRTFQDNLPLWWGRLCNGGVCYCNDGDGCNQSNRMFNILSLLPTIICMVPTYAHEITL